MRLDSHQHFWIYSPQDHSWIDDTMPDLRRDFLPEHLRPELQSRDFQGSVAVQASQTLDETRWLLDLAETHHFIKGVVGWVDLRSKGVARDLTSFQARPKLCGIRHIVQSEPDDRFLLRPDFRRGLAILPDFDLAFDLLVYPRQLPAAIELAGLLPHQRFVLDHLAKPEIKSGRHKPWAALVRELAVHPNVYAKVSGLVTEADWHDWSADDLRPYLDVVFEAFGPQRLMVGSDWPVCTLAGTYGHVMDLVLDYLRPLPAADQEAVLGGTAARFYRLPRTEAASC